MSENVTESSLYQGLYLYAHGVLSIDLQVKAFDEINKSWGAHENIHEDISFTTPTYSIPFSTILK